MRRIHHPGRSLGANVMVWRSLPLNVPTPVTGASPPSPRRRPGKGHDLSAASLVSSIFCSRNLSYAAAIALASPITVRPILYSGMSVIG